jgi:Methyltransferase domain
MMKQCPICCNSQHPYFQETVLRKYRIDYFYCDLCGLLQTEEPYWLDEAYQNAVSSADTGLIQRNIMLSKLLSCVLFFLCDRQGKYLDIGGGYGVLTRLLRDTGFDAYWSDPYCENLFAQGFEASTVSAPFHAVTAFEVLEHIHQPLEFLQTSMKAAGTSTIIFSTELFANSPPKPDSWDYYAFNTGQHISFYQRKTLEYLAQTLSLSLLSYHDFHILTDQKMSHLFFRLINSRFIKILERHVRKKMTSKTLTDYKKLIQLV